MGCHDSFLYLSYGNEEEEEERKIRNKFSVDEFNEVMRPQNVCRALFCPANSEQGGESLPKVIYKLVFTGRKLLLSTQNYFQ